MASLKDKHGSKNSPKQNAQSSDARENTGQVPSSVAVELVPGRTAPQAGTSHADPTSDDGVLLEKRREETLNTPVKRGRPNPSDLLGAEAERKETPKAAVKRKTPPSSPDSEPEPSAEPEGTGWSHFDVLFDPHRRGNRCSVTEDCNCVYNSDEMDDCPDLNRKAGTWGIECLSLNYMKPSQYWYLSIEVSFLNELPLFTGPLCEVGVGTEYALCINRSNSQGSQARYIQSTLSLDYTQIKRLAELNEEDGDSQDADELDQPLRVDLGFYWNLERGRVHILHLKKHSSPLLYSDNVSEIVDVWPVVSVTPISQCGMEVSVWVLRPNNCLFAPDLNRQDIQAIVDAD